MDYSNQERYFGNKGGNYQGKNYYKKVKFVFF